MSIRRFVPGALTLTFVTLVAALLTAASGASTLAQQSSTGTVRCKAVAKGTPWSYQGKKGNLYRIEGNRTWACAIGVKWLARLTNMRGVSPKIPGWNCLTFVSFPGECENKNGVIFAWNNKPK